MKRLTLASLLLLLVAALVFAGCGGSSNDSMTDATTTTETTDTSTDTTTETTNTTDTTDTSSTDSASSETTETTSTSTDSATSTLPIELGEMYIKPGSTTIKAGTYTIDVTNKGKMLHEAVFLKTDVDQAKLPVKNGTVDESTSVGEVADVKAGENKSGSITFKPGKYVIVCNIAGHYQAGMHVALTVTA